MEIRIARSAGWWEHPHEKHVVCRVNHHSRNRVNSSLQVAGGRFKSATCSHCCALRGMGWSGDTTPCKVTPVILHGIAPAILHGVVSPKMGCGRWGAGMRPLCPVRQCGSWHNCCSTVLSLAQVLRNSVEAGTPVPHPLGWGRVGLSGVGCWRRGCCRHSLTHSLTHSRPRHASRTGYRGGKASLLIRKHDRFTPTGEIRRHVTALACDHAEDWKLQEHTYFSRRAAPLATLCPRSFATEGWRMAGA